MDAYQLLQAGLEHPTLRRLPAAWRHLPTISGYRSIEDLLDGVRDAGASSDPLIATLLTVGSERDLADRVLLVGLMPHAISRTNGRRDAVDEVLGELAIAIGEARTGVCEVGVERVGFRLLNRALSRMRLRRRTNGTIVFPCDPQAPWFDRPSSEPGPADIVSGRADFDDLRDQLRSCGKSVPKVTTAYATMLGFLEHPPTPADSHRLRYARRVLRAAAASCLNADAA